MPSSCLEPSASRESSDILHDTSAVSHINHLALQMSQLVLCLLCLPHLSFNLNCIVHPSDYDNIFKWAVVLGINNFIMMDKSALIEEARKERKVHLCTIILK